MNSLYKPVDQFFSVNITIRQKLIFIFSIILLLTLILFTRSQLTINLLSERINRIIELRVPSQKLDLQLKMGIDKSHIALTSWAMHHDEIYEMKNKKAWVIDIMPAKEAFTELSKNWVEPDNIERLRLIDLLLVKLKSTQKRVLEASLDPALQSRLLYLEAIPTAEKLNDLIDDLTQSHTYLLKKDVNHINETINKHREQQFTLLLVFLFFCSVLVFAIVRSITKSVKSLKLTAVQLASSSAKPLLREKSRDELSSIGLAMENLALQLFNSKTEATNILKQEAKEVYEAIMDGVIIIDEKGEILNFNQAAEALFGYDCEEVLGKNIKLLMPVNDSQNHDHYLKKYKEFGKAKIIGIGRVVEGLTKDKTAFPLHLNIKEIPAIGGGKHYIGFCHDLTEIKVKEEQIRRNQKMDALGKLTGGIAHDFNNLLGIIIGYSDLLKIAFTEKSQTKFDKYLGEISHAGTRGEKITSKLLAFSKKSTNKNTITNINNLLSEQEHFLRTTLTVEVKLTFNLAADLWQVLIDFYDFEDAILNLVINSRDAMRDNYLPAQIIFETTNVCIDKTQALKLQMAEGEYVQLSISDNGTGMKEEIKDNIFDPFYTTKGAKGTGLGLSQVFGFIQRVSGSIKVYSEQNNGCKFVMYLPRYVGQSDGLLIKGGSATASENLDPEISLNKEKTILIVDDEAALRELASEILSVKGYQILMAEDGKQALKILETQPIDLMISDVIMPEMNGYQLAEIVSKKYPETKIQMISGYTDKLESSKSVLIKTEIIHKPYSAMKLQQSVYDLLKSDVVEDQI